jgi:hypothetical protein
VIQLHRLVRTARVVTLAVATGLAATTLAVPAASAAPAPPTPAPAVLPADFFGVHHAGLGLDPTFGWPRVSGIGSVRLWDNGVSWRDIETSPGVYDWTRLDAIVARTSARKAKALLVLGQTPSFHAQGSAPAGVSEFYGTGATRMPSKDAWVNYVRAVAQRYGLGLDYQVWNEANVSGFWSSSMYEMALLTRWAREALNTVDKRLRLVAPAFGTRLGRDAIYTYYGQKPEGIAVARFVNAVSLQLYPTETYGPERSVDLLNAAKALLAKRKVNLPIYNTEINYGMRGGATARGAAPIAAKYQVAYASRTLVLNAGNRVSRVYWYVWDMKRTELLNGTQGNTLLVGPDGHTPSAAGNAFAVTRGWLFDTRPRGCTKDRAGTYTCTFKYKTGTALKRIIWNPAKNVTVTMPKYTTAYYLIDGKKRASKAGAKVRVGPVPVMVRTSR